MVNECQLGCLLAVAMFAGQLYIMFNYNKKRLLDRFDSLLNEEQRATYKLIVNERLKLYVQGIILGLVLGFIYLSIASNKTMGRACIFTVIVLSTNYFYYMLYPKSDYMVPYLNTQEQRVAWLDIYREMQYRCKMGFLLGLVAYLLLGYFVDF